MWLVLAEALSENWVLILLGSRSMSPCLSLGLEESFLIRGDFRHSRSSDSTPEGMKSLQVPLMTP